MKLRLLLVALMAALAASPVPAQTGAVPASYQADLRPLSPAQIALFEPPRLQGIGCPETLTYNSVREGAARYGTKNVTFDFLTDHGPRRLRHRLLGVQRL